MNAAEQLAPVITDALTWPQICDQYPDQWVCVVEIQWDEPRMFHFRNARVVGHGATRREPYPKIGHFFTGKIIAPFPRLFA